MENFQKEGSQEFYPDIDLMADESHDSFGIFSGLEDINSEFTYEDFEKITGKTYHEYLRFHDDMT